MKPEDVLNLRPSFFMMWELATGRLPSDKIVFTQTQERLGLSDPWEIDPTDISLCPKHIREASVVEIGLKKDFFELPDMVGVKGIRVYVVDGFPVTRQRIKDEICKWFHELMENFPDDEDEK